MYVCFPGIEFGFRYERPAGKSPGTEKQFSRNPRNRMHASYVFKQTSPQITCSRKIAYTYDDKGCDWTFPGTELFIQTVQSIKWILNRNSNGALLINKSVWVNMIIVKVYLSESGRTFVVCLPKRIRKQYSKAHNGVRDRDWGATNVLTEFEKKKPQWIAKSFLYKKLYITVTIYNYI